MPLVLSRPFVRDLDTWDRLVAAHADGRIADLIELIADDGLLPLAEGTAVRVEQDHATLVAVRLLDGPHAGRRGWLPRSALPAASLATAAA